MGWGGRGGRRTLPAAVGSGPSGSPRVGAGGETTSPRFGATLPLFHPARMTLAAFFAFVWGALIGLFMAVWHFMGKTSGRALGIAHGAFTLSGIVLLLVGLLTIEASHGWWILIAFLVTAAGGAYLFSRQVRDEPWPGFVIIAHGGLAIASIILLGLFLANAEPGVGEGQNPDVPAARTENPTVSPDELTQ